MKLYRPVGLYEMEKILNSNGKEFPARFLSQPYFYPVLNVEYAKEIAFKWNKDHLESGYVGFVTEFEINDEFIKKYEVHCVGNSVHQELWIPSDELDEFNMNIINGIKITHAFYGKEYKGVKPSNKTGFKEEDIDKQLDILSSTLKYNAMDFSGTVYVESNLVNLNLLYWKMKANVNMKVIESLYGCLLKNNKCFVISNGGGNYDRA